MDKIYWFIANDGGWGGCNKLYVVATSPEEAKNTKEYLNWSSIGLYEVSEPHELTNKDILQELGLFREFKDKIEFNYNIVGGK